MIRAHGVRAAALTLILAASAGAAEVSRRLDDYVLFASDHIRTRDVHVVSGDLGPHLLHPGVGAVPHPVWSRLGTFGEYRVGEYPLVAFDVSDGCMAQRKLNN